MGSSETDPAVSPAFDETVCRPGDPRIMLLRPCKSLRHIIEMLGPKHIFSNFPIRISLVKVEHREALIERRSDTAQISRADELHPLEVVEISMAEASNQPSKSLGLVIAQRECPIPGKLLESCKLYQPLFIGVCSSSNYPRERDAWVKLNIDVFPLDDQHSPNGEGRSSCSGPSAQSTYPFAETRTFTLAKEIVGRRRTRVSDNKCCDHHWQDDPPPMLRPRLKHPHPHENRIQRGRA